MPQLLEECSSYLGHRQQPRRLPHAVAWVAVSLAPMRTTMLMIHRQRMVLPSCLRLPLAATPDTSSSSFLRFRKFPRVFNRGQHRRIQSGKHWRDRRCAGVCMRHFNLNSLPSCLRVATWGQPCDKGIPGQPRARRGL